MNKKSLLLSATFAILCNSAVAQENTLPPPGDDVSLEKFDQYFDGLKDDIGERLNQLGVNGDGGLKDPNVEGYASDLELLSASQREILLLESRLKQAQLARQVWEVIHSDRTDDYLAEISALKSSLSMADQEREQALAARETAEIQLEELLSRTAILESELKIADDTINGLESDLAGAKSEREALRSEQRSSSNIPTPTSANDMGVVSAPRIPDVQVESITSVAGKMFASIQRETGAIVSMSVGDQLSPDVVISAITTSGVQVIMDSNTYDLPFVLNRMQDVAPPMTDNQQDIEIQNLLEQAANASN